MLSGNDKNLAAPDHDETLNPVKYLDAPYTIKDYAYSGGRAVSRLEVTLDDGITWTLADIIRAEETTPHAARHELTPHQTQQATTAADATATNTGTAATATGTNTGAETATATGSAVTNTATATSYYGRMMGYAASSQLTYTTVIHTGSSVYEGELTDISKFVSSSDCSSKRLFVTPISDFLQVRNCEERNDELGIRQLRSKFSCTSSFSLGIDATITTTQF